MRRRLPGAARLGAALALGLGALAAAGCGDSAPNADVAAGKQTFTNLCSSCHTLIDAGTPPSNIGPDLDDAFRASRQVGIDDTVFEGVVRRWIQIAQPPMPRDLVTGQDAIDVSAYIAKVAGTTAESTVRPAPPLPPEAPEPPRQEIQDGS